MHDPHFPATSAYHWFHQMFCLESHSGLVHTLTWKVLPCPWFLLLGCSLSGWSRSGFSRSLHGARLVVSLSGVVNFMRLALRLAGWLDTVCRKADSWLSLGSLWLLTSSWLCLDRCLVIGGVVLFIELVFCAFFFRLLDIAEEWGSSVASCGSSWLVLFVLDRLISLARTIHSKYITLNRFRPFRSSSAGQNAQCKKIMATYLAT